MLQRLGFPIAAVLLMTGHLLPWAAHKTAALTLSAHELAVFTNFTPGAGIFLNEWFYLPLWSAALLVALWAGRSPDLLVRMFAGILSAGVASLGLPTYPQVLTAFRNPDFQLQFFVSLAVMAMALLLALLRTGTNAAVRVLAAAVLAALSAVPLAGYLSVRPFIEQLYHDGIGIGLGWWITLAGVLALLSFAIAGQHVLSKFPPDERV